MELGCRQSRGKISLTRQTFLCDGPVILPPKVMNLRAFGTQVARAASAGILASSTVQKSSEDNFSYNREVIVPLKSIRLTYYCAQSGARASTKPTEDQLDTTDRLLQLIGK